jgi:hypothetical protein
VDFFRTVNLTNGERARTHTRKTETRQSPRLFTPIGVFLAARIIVSSVTAVFLRDPFLAWPTVFKNGNAPLFDDVVVEASSDSNEFTPIESTSNGIDRRAATREQSHQRTQE